MSHVKPGVMYNPNRQVTFFPERLEGSLHIFFGFVVSRLFYQNCPALFGW